MTKKKYSFYFDRFIHNFQENEDVQRLALNYDIAMTIQDEIVPYHLEYFLGLRHGDEDDDGHEGFPGIDEEDEDDEDDDDEDDGHGHKHGKNCKHGHGHGKPKAGGAAGAGKYIFLWVFI